MGWTANSGRYSATKWYCSFCEKRTKIEFNPEWVALGMPLKWEGERTWTWHSRCSVCWREQWDEGSYDCPRCGCPSDPPEWCEEDGHFESSTFIEQTKVTHNPRYSFDYGVSGYDWEEKHKCRKCRKVWWFTNSSC